MNLPNDLKIHATATNGFAPRADGTVTIGITDHAQAALGDLVYVELPEGRPHCRGAAKRAQSSSRSRRQATSTRRWPAKIVAVQRQRSRRARGGERGRLRRVAVPDASPADAGAIVGNSSTRPRTRG